VLINLDAVPGKANRLIARSADAVISAAEVVGPCADRGWPVVPPIVRRSAMTGLSPAECRGRLGLDPARKTLLVTGGSQGAVSINRTVLRTFKDHAKELTDWQVIHQTGKGEEESAGAAYRAAGISAVVRAFFENMGEAWRASDLAVSRAGAGGVADAWAYHIPTLFMPNPYHKDQHQKHNAARLVRIGAARIIDDLMEETSNAEHAGVALRELLLRDDARRTMTTALQALGPADGASRLAAILAADA
jgi:UDP-N-acetylglucosamine--N-acetylmuramyl-(pentapeptide) pyrophosphoryl-undecaprenol N-acetylglucosamine transferase